jgi:hypothetical protein
MMLPIFLGPNSSKTFRLELAVALDQLHFHVFVQQPAQQRLNSLFSLTSHEPQRGQSGSFPRLLSSSSERSALVLRIPITQQFPVTQIEARYINSAEDRPDPVNSTTTFTY